MFTLLLLHYWIINGRVLAFTVYIDALLIEIIINAICNNQSDPM